MTFDQWDRWLRTRHQPGMVHVPQQALANYLAVASLDVTTKSSNAMLAVQHGTTAYWLVGRKPPSWHPDPQMRVGAGL